MANGFSGTGLSECSGSDDQRDELYDVLSDSTRRFALRYLRSVEGTVPLEELTTELVARQVDRPVSDRTLADRDAVEVALHHQHLPKMDAAGFLDYDSDGGTITATDRTEEARTALRTGSDD